MVLQLTQNTQVISHKTTAQDFDFLSGADIQAAYKAQEIIHKNIQEQGTQVPFFKKKNNHGGFKKPHSLDVHVPLRVLV